MEPKQKNGGWLKNVAPGTWLTIIVIIAQFVASWAIRGAQLKNFAERLDKVEAAEQATEIELRNHEVDIRVHYMTGSPLTVKIDEIGKDVVCVRENIAEIKALLKK